MINQLSNKFKANSKLAEDYIKLSKKALKYSFIITLLSIFLLFLGGDLLMIKLFVLLISVFTFIVSLFLLIIFKAAKKLSEKADLALSKSESTISRVAEITSLKVSNYNQSKQNNDPEGEILQAQQKIREGKNSYSTMLKKPFK